MHGTTEMEAPHTLPDAGSYIVTLWLDAIEHETTKKRRFCGGAKKNVVILRQNK